jgi:predicted Zn finger-like uncharacterized protein
MTSPEVPLTMTDSSSPLQTTIVRLEDEPDVWKFATCPMCHTTASVTQSAIQAGDAWRCARCGQHWDATRLEAVAAYAAWVLANQGVASGDVQKV